MLLFFPLAYILKSISYSNPNFSEWYSTKIYPLISIPINYVTSIFSFSLAEVLIILVILTVIIYIILYIIKFIKYKNQRKSNTLKLILNFLCACSTIYFIFIIFTGINYNRLTFADKSGLTIKPSSKSELIILCNELIKQANTLRTQVEVDDNSIMKLNSNYNTAIEASIAYAKMSDEFETLLPNYGKPKPVFFSKLMSYANITGVFFPYTFEANVNTNIPNYSIPSTMCHELTHQRGYMREDEANFLAYLACLKSDKVEFKYSGVMLAYIHASNALYDIDKEAYIDLYSKLSEGVKIDLNYNNKYWDKFETKIAKISNEVNNVYLKINSQEDGVESYGRMVDLLLANYRKNNDI